MDCLFAQAIDFLLQDKAVAFPTDTVYGLGVRVQAQQGRDLLFNLKQRDRNKQLVIYVNRVQDIETIIQKDLHSSAYKLAETFFPGPLTLVVDNKNIKFEPKLGFRIVRHPIVCSLIDYVGPLLATSANLSSFPSSLFASDVQETFYEKKDDIFIFPGSCNLGLESTVIDADLLKVYREGVISVKEIESCLALKVLVVPQKKQFSHLQIFTLKNEFQLQTWLSKTCITNYLIEKDPMPFHFYPLLRQALRQQVNHVIFVYDELTTAHPILRPFLSPYLVENI